MHPLSELPITMWTLLVLKGNIIPKIIMGGDFNILHFPWWTDDLDFKKIRKETSELSYSVRQIGPLKMDRRLYPTATWYMLFM
jgi:hypothetical protein